MENISDTDIYINKLKEHKIENIDLIIFRIQDLFYLYKNTTKSECFVEIDNTDVVDENSFPKLKMDNNIYFTTDIHGNIDAFLFALLKSGVAKYKENEQDIIYFDMLNKQIVDIKSYNNTILNIIPIPNLIINPNFKGEFIYGGDIIDRGFYSDSCICLIYYLLNQDISNKIKYIVGNHESMLLENNFENWKYNGGNSLFSYIKENDKSTIIPKETEHFNLLKDLISDLLDKNKLIFNTCVDTTIFSHTIFYKSRIIEALECVNDFSDTNKLNELKVKVSNDIQLDNNDINLLSCLLNKLFISNYKNINSDSTNKARIKELFNETKPRKTNSNSNKKQSLFKQLDKKRLKFDLGKNKGLLWSRPEYLVDNKLEIDFSKFCEKEKSRIKGLNQVVGHTIVSKESFDNPICNKGIIFADTAQTYHNVATLLEFKPQNTCKIHKKDMEYIGDIELNFERISEMSDDIESCLQEMQDMEQVSDISKFNK